MWGGEREVGCKSRGCTIVGWREERGKFAQERKKVGEKREGWMTRGFKGFRTMTGIHIGEESGVGWIGK